MNTKLIISICLILVSMIGVGCVSAADNQTSIQTNVEEMNVEMANEENLIQTQSESVNQVEKSANTIGSSNNGIKGNWPFHNGIKDHTNIKHNQIIKSGVNNTTNQTIRGPKIKPKLDIKGPKTKGSNLNISGPKIKPKGAIKGPKINVSTTIKGPKINEPKILNKSKTFDYKGEKVYLALIENSKGNRELKCFKASSSGSGLGGAGGSYVSEVGFEIVDILEERGVFKKMAYGTSWLFVKVARLFDDDITDDNEKQLINWLAFGDLSVCFN